MEKKIEILRRENQIISKWSGGSTTELAIYPKESKYIDRNFDWRISTAIVEAQKTTFTNLPEYERHLMLLNGEMKLEHKNNHSTILVPFEKDVFSGSWSTESTGKGTDFNLMLNKNWRGRLEELSLKSQQVIVIDVSNNEKKSDFLGVYCYNGQINLEFEDDKRRVLREKDFAMMPIHKNFKLTIRAECESNIVLTRVKKLCFAIIDLCKNIEKLLNILIYFSI